MKPIKKILLIIQRSNGDVFLSASLIKSLYENYNSPKIDLLINDDTLAVARMLPNINNIHTFSYFKKKNNRFKQEIDIFKIIFKNYDLSINLTASDRSVIYAILAGNFSISAVEKNNQKSWWKRKFLNKYYFFDSSKHILLNNLESLKILKIDHHNIQYSLEISNKEKVEFQDKLKSKGIGSFIIFHPSAQYLYKVYPRKQRDKLLDLLSSLGLPVIVTGGFSEIDIAIKNDIPNLPNLYNFIGQTSLKEYIILSDLSLAFIGMDTLNMHIAASQSKRIFAIFGPSNINMWAPWSNHIRSSTRVNKPIQTYGKNTIFQSSNPCEICGKVGCGSNHERDLFSFNIPPEVIFDEVRNWLKSYEF